MFHRIGLIGLLVWVAGAGAETATCLFTFAELRGCNRHGYTVDIHSERIAEDERRLESLRVAYGDRTQTLRISPDTTMLEGDRGQVVFEDINFDRIPDLAVTTSFGLANLFLDYWVFDPARKRFRYIGNYARLTPEPDSETLHSRIRINAAEYERRTYRWEGDALVRSTR